MSEHVMVDIETLGSKPGSVILSIGAVRFAGGAYREFYYRIDLASSLLAGFTIDPATVQWWREQDREAKHAAFFREGETGIENALEQFARFVDKDTRLWAKGPDFDCVLLAAAYEKLNLKLPWNFRNMRDVRTILAVSGVEQSKAGAHDALNDAKNQAEAVLEAHALLGRTFSE